MSVMIASVRPDWTSKIVNSSRGGKSVIFTYVWQLRLLMMLTMFDDVDDACISQVTISKGGSVIGPVSGRCVCAT